MRLVLGTFARSGIEGLLGRELPAGVRTALRHYARGGGPDGASPQLVCGHRLGRDGVGVDLDVDAETADALERRRRESDGVSMEQLTAHAVLAYLADLDLCEERRRETTR